MSFAQRGAWCVFAMAVVAFSAAGVLAQVQNKEQQVCLAKLNKDGAGVAKAQGKENVSCLKSAGKGKLIGTVQDCLTADLKEKVSRKRDKTTADNVKLCGVAPDFAYVSATAVNDGAQQAEIDLFGDVFGVPAGTAVIDCAADKAGCVCQQKVAKAVEKVIATQLKVFVKCKKDALTSGASSAAAIEACVDDAGVQLSIENDFKQKINRRVVKIQAISLKKCQFVSNAFPNKCDLPAGMALADCLHEQARCRVCQAINDMDGLSVNCDDFDNGALDTTCASGAGPLPTPTDTPVPGVVFQGALPMTTGRFTYQATVGISGADAECAAQYAGTHACLYSELQAAEAAGDLIGAQDTGGNPVASFWAIDPTRPDTDQCTTTIAWDYATAHTGHFADSVTLNNGTGALGSLTSGSLCALQRWVGCCS